MPHDFPLLLSGSGDNSVMTQVKGSEITPDHGSHSDPNPPQNQVSGCHELVVEASLKQAHVVTNELQGQFEELAAESEIIPLGMQTMNIASVVYRDLRIRGLLIAPMDLLIAATCLEYNCVMVTANIRHFENIPDLVCENWSISSS